MMKRNLEAERANFLLQNQPEQETEMKLSFEIDSWRISW